MRPSIRYRDAQSHDSLDQTRAGTIVCTENTTLASICNAYVAHEWRQVFVGNRTSLKVVGLERMRYAGFKDPRLPARLLPNVLRLDMSFDPLAVNRNVCCFTNTLAFADMLSECGGSRLELHECVSRLILWHVYGLSQTRTTHMEELATKRLSGWFKPWIAPECFYGALS